MKTTVEISDQLLEDAKRVAARDKSTLRELIEDGLRRVLSDRKKRPPFKLKDASFRGQGLRPELRGEGWDRIRDEVYRGHGA